MGVATSEASALDQLAAARLRGAKPDELLELAEAAVDQATAAGDAQTVEAVAEELDLAAPVHSDEGDGLRLRLAAGRARALASRPSAFAASDAESEDLGVPMTAKVAFWVTVTLAALTAFLIGAMAGQADDSGYGIALVLALVVVLGGLFIALTGAVGLVQRRAGSWKGTLMSAVPLVVVALLIVVRISLSLF